jgi:hypothetical protein
MRVIQSLTISWETNFYDKNTRFFKKSYNMTYFYTVLGYFCPDVNSKKF